MKEIGIRKEAIKILEKEKWIVWYPSKTRWKKEQDIFGVFDLIVLKPLPYDNRIDFIQLTTLSNVRAREKKIKNWFTKNKIKSFPAKVWGWNNKKKEFKILKVK